MSLAVLVPVLARPRNVIPLAVSYARGCPKDSVLVFLVSHGDSDELSAVLSVEDGERIRHLELKSGYDSWPHKINAGVDEIQADWYLFAADDITFTPGWWEATLEYRNGTAGVIGTADAFPGEKGNPAVAAGAHTCHPLVRGTYIREYGTIDDPTKAVHDGFSHWCVDNELVATARKRDAWAFCRGAVIRHNHPYWERGEWDETYSKGEENAQADVKLWMERAEHFGLDR